MRTWHRLKRIRGWSYVAVAFLIQLSHSEAFPEGPWCFQVLLQDRAVYSASHRGIHIGLTTKENDYDVLRPRSKGGGGTHRGPRLLS